MKIDGSDSIFNKEFKMREHSPVPAGSSALTKNGTFTSADFNDAAKRALERLQKSSNQVKALGGCVTH
ncbi:MAG: hypothetical protein HYR60_20620 [Acidobacteria bacterium]|nr:hypothetical protein [Acidobacteriota bacterium]